jgi:hypothetical protein
MSTNGKIIFPMDKAEALFWWRVKSLKKMIKARGLAGDVVGRAMWTNKLYELSKNIDKRRYAYGE